MSNKTNTLTYEMADNYCNELIAHIYVKVEEIIDKENPYEFSEIKLVILKEKILKIIKDAKL